MNRSLSRQEVFRVAGLAAAAILYTAEIAVGQTTFPLLDTGSPVTWNTTLWTLGGTPPQTATQVGLLRGGGTITIDASSTATTPGGLLIGHSGDFDVEMSEGTLTVGATAGDGRGAFGLTVGESGTGAFAQTGGLVTAPLVNLGRVSGDGGAYTLTGGTLATAEIRRGSAAGALNLNGGTIQVTGTAASLVGLTVTTDVQAGGAFINTNGFDALIAAPLAGVGGLTKSGSGTLLFSAYSTYNGLTTISAGTLQNGSTTSPTDVINSGSYAVASGARLVFGRNEDFVAFTSQSISGAGDVEFVGQEAGYFTFRADRYTGALTYTGQTIVNLTSGSIEWFQNALWFEKDNVLPNETVLDLQSGKVITRNQTASGLTIAGLTGNAGTAIATDGNAASVQKWTLNVASGTSHTFAGAIGSFGSPTTDNIALTKTGAGTQILSGTNTYTGGTTITGGRLEIAPTGRLSNSGAITINGLGAELRYNASTSLTAPLTFTQGTISGTGTIGTAVTVATNRILAPGNSPGVQAYSAGLTWSPGGTYQWEINDATGVAGTNWDLLDVSGGDLDLSGLSAGNTFNLDLTTLTGTAGGPMANYVDGQAYTFSLATYASLALPENFSGNDLTSLMTLSFANWENAAPSLGNVSIVNDAATSTINLVIVPEPGAIALLAAGAAAAARPWPRRRTRGT